MILHSPGHWLELEEVTSTQDVAMERLKAGEKVGAVFADHQTGGRGRFGRVWESKRGDSLTMSLVFAETGGAQPWLVGMAVACSCARVLGCELRWPNDLVLGSDCRKLGGILTELVEGFPVVGVGVNLGQGAIHPDLDAIATSLEDLRATPEEIALRIVAEIESFPMPNHWADLVPYWAPLDRTEGKLYRSPTGEMLTAVKVGNQGELLAFDETGKLQSVMAADALFGAQTPRAPTSDRIS
ncbi:MAG: biotin--[acetyl-CoA-carboxylase] ligase [Fimbriimonadaceae bacterium]